MLNPQYAAYALVEMLGEIQNCYNKGLENEEPITISEIDALYELATIVNDHLNEN